MIEVDRERCIGSGMCAMTAPDVFDQSDNDGRVRLLTESPEPEAADAIRLAVTLCPSQALALSEPLTAPERVEPRETEANDG